MKWDERWINSMKWSWFKVPVKVEQINEYLFSDTVQKSKNKKWQWWNKPRSIIIFRSLYNEMGVSIEHDTIEFEYITISRYIKRREPLKLNWCTELYVCWERWLKLSTQILYCLWYSKTIDFDVALEVYCSTGLDVKSTLFYGQLVNPASLSVIALSIGNLRVDGGGTNRR